jgi:hypothetical protein
MGPRAAGRRYPNLTGGRLSFSGQPEPHEFTSTTGHWSRTRVTEQGKSQKRIREAEVKIRDYLTLDTRIRRRYTRNRRSWNIVVAALDALGDSELALAAYLNGRPSSDGEAYLRLYGVLQAVIVEQDAISHLTDELAKKGTASSLLDRGKFKAIRRLRIKVAGHPVLTKDLR